ncbi:uncharacterized protein LOC126907694 [Daktulosphaira vitifoliae]|uniref:uncharacterized protein LOC126907694 n=1 Tax=Daktulosphaira vitifoliae TaxID=58002 RepID=UPI0021AA45F7|nr:uncharacterized protein LOC126907694 [Daktulosphaira vitifoliae]XP_050545134.1 uncharacterized protein LOC126907694 [Daktulosphaira vitifoliae]
MYDMPNVVVFAFLLSLLVTSCHGKNFKICYGPRLNGPCSQLVVPTKCQSLRNEFYDIKNGSLYNIATNIGSVNTYGNCIRIFKYEHCRGSSLALHNGLESLDNLRQIGFDKAESISPCFEEECVQEKQFVRIQPVYLPPSIQVCRSREFKKPCVDLLLSAKCLNLSLPGKDDEKLVSSIFNKQHEKLDNTIKSINTRNKCIRIYSSNNCTGNSMQLYPGSPSHNDLTALNWNATVSSISPCSISCIEWPCDNFRPLIPKRLWLGPHITVCDKNNFTGACANIPLLSSCKNLKSEWYDNGQRIYSVRTSIASIKTYNRCIMVYEDDDCLGQWTMIDSTSKSHNNLDIIGWANRISSIGSCTSRRYKRYVNKSTKIGLNDKGLCGFFDIFHIGPIPGRPIEVVNEFNNPIVNYQRGHGGRVEYVVALIHRRHLHAGSNVDNHIEYFARSLGEPDNDQASHLVGWQLGGPGSQRYNIIPQNAHFGQSPWTTKVEKLVHSTVRNSSQGLVRYELNPIYADSRATRPHSIAYRVADGDHLIQQGQIPNPNISELLSIYYPKLEEEYDDNFVMNTINDNDLNENDSISDNTDSPNIIY